jgi:hypothetical protein
MQIGNNNKYLLLLFEVWDPENYKHTAYLVVDTDGNLYGTALVMELCFPLRLMKADNPIQISSNEVLLVQGEEDGSLSTYKITISGLD